MFGDCKACLAKDAHIKDLQAQVESLSKLVYPKSSENDITVVAQELDQILSGSTEVVDIPSDELSADEHALLTNNYTDTELY